MKRNIINFTVVLICLLIQVQISFAQKSAPVELGLLNDKAKTLAKPSDPFDVSYGFLSGEVRVNVLVDEKGNVIKADAVSGDEKLRFEAVEAAKGSKFTPYLMKGKAVKVKGFLTFQFGESNGAFLKKSIENNLSDEKKKDEARKLYNKGDYEGAIKLLNDLVDSAFLNTSERELRALCFYKLNDYKNALKDVEVTIKLRQEGTPATVFNLQGDIYVQLTDYTKAVESYTKVIEIDPKNIEAYGNRGYAYSKLSKKAESIADFKKVIEIDPKDKYALYNLDALSNNRKVLSREEYKKLKQIYYV
ncbi:MAG TPA: tetratricopeptide repeat protein [Pyrinomonadaceae bacterium]|nr:tetratricopeptide repeat protein [Pyrinomonadaceae bacterium]